MEQPPFYLLEQDLRPSGVAAVGAVPEEMDPDDWVCGKIMPPPPKPLVLPLMKRSGDYRGDLMGGLLTLFSDELKNALNHYGVNNVDYFPVELLDQNSGEKEAGYWLANVIGRVACVDVAKSTMVPMPSGGRNLKSFYINAAATRGLPIFRLNENPVLLIISEALRNHLKGVGLAGVRMRRTQDYDGW